MRDKWVNKRRIISHISFLLSSINCWDSKLKGKGLNLFFFLLWRSEAAAGERRQGCKSLTNAHCLVSQHSTLRSLFFWPLCWICLRVASAFPQMKVSDVSHFQIRAKDNCFFTLKCFDDSVHHFKVSPKNDPEGTRKVSLVSP